MGAYPIRNGQVLFECRECISGQKTINQFQKVGSNLVEKFARNVCDLKQQTSRRRRRGRTNRIRFKFSRKKRTPKKSRKPRSVKKSRKRRRVKKSRKRRSVKKTSKKKDMSYCICSGANKTKGFTCSRKMNRDI